MPGQQDADVEADVPVVLRTKRFRMVVTPTAPVLERIGDATEPSFIQFDAASGHGGGGEGGAIRHTGWMGMTRRPPIVFHRACESGG